MSEIFIVEWHISDYAGRRETSMRSEDTINGEHVYACKKLTSWFRLGKYLIKHDVANYLLGLTKHMSKRYFMHNVKDFELNNETGKLERVNCVDEIVSLVNERFGGNEYVHTIMKLQEELDGYERCYYFSDVLGIDFDYKEFLKDKDAYQNRLIDLFRKDRERNE